MNRDSYRFFKRFFDIAGALFLAGFFLPIALVALVLIKLTSRGPILFTTTVVGLHGKPFTIYKFRTMEVNNDNSKHRALTQQLVQNNQPCSYDTNGVPLYKLKEDERTTPIGRYLRRFSIDELPQLINVFKGEMSLVGPRPSIMYEYQHYTPWHAERLNVLPGITGLYQVTKRYRASFEEMVAIDIDYIHELSLKTDLTILMKTPFAMLHGL